MGSGARPAGLSSADSRSWLGMRALKVCAVPGCVVPARPGETTCASHRRVRGKAWRKLREQVLARDRYRCVVCGAGATQVHHRTPLTLGGPALPPLDQLDSRCDQHNPPGRYQEDEGPVSGHPGRA
jgi:hypothetical protein